jgi:HD superfamily phosphohydrolase
MLKSRKYFKDAIHGLFDLPYVCSRVINTREFQRLRDIKQLGGVYHVFPSASHNRFDHCIGTAHLANEFATQLQKKQPSLDISETDILCVTIAALCHDLGHGTYSHLFDGKFIPCVSPGSKWSHEDNSVRLLDALVENNKLGPLFEECGIGEKDRVFIREMITCSPQGETKTGKWKYEGRPASKSFLYEIVSNKRTGIDVDKFDYFARDSHALGFPCAFDSDRLMKFARVCKVDEEWQICFPEKEVWNIYELFHARYNLHKRAYQHPVSGAIEREITRALVLAEPHLYITGTDGKQMRLSETLDDMKAYVQVTDSILQRIQNSTEMVLEPARKALNNVATRAIKKCIHEELLPPLHNISPPWTQADEDIIKHCFAVAANDMGGFMVEFVSINYGMRDRNPVDNVRFFSASNPDEARQIDKQSVSCLIPSVFSE